MEKSQRFNVSNQQELIRNSFSHGINLNLVETEDIQTFESSEENDANMTGDHPELIGESNRITSHPINEFESVEIESERRPRSAPAHVRSSTANATQFRNSREGATSTNVRSGSRASSLRELEAALPYSNATRNASLVEDRSLARRGRDRSLARSGRDRPRERNVSTNHLKYYLRYYQTKVRIVVAAEFS